MNVAAIGVGGAGGRLLNRLAGRNGLGSGSPISSAFAIDTDRGTLGSHTAVPAENRHLIGQFETDGEGTDGDRELGRSIVEDQRLELRRTVEDGIRTTVDAIVLLAGLGGGTGSAVTPSIAADLDEVYEQPVYTVSVLPAETETDQQVRRNTATALAELEGAVAGQIAMDNDAWLWGARTLESHGDVINGEFVTRLTELLTISQGGGQSGIGQQVVDASDLMGTIDGGGLATIGYASTPLSKWRGGDSSVFGALKRRFAGEETDPQTQERAISRTLEWATRGTLTFDCPPDSARRGLVAFSGPPEWLRGDAIARGRDWLADRIGTAELRSGDDPTPGAESIGVLVVFAGITGTDRLEAFDAGD
jgi:cell division GTPase FtsZ